MSLLTIQELSHEYGDTRLYRNISLEVNREDHMGLVGPNGAGKSTLLKTVSYTHLDVYKRQQEYTR